jgi:hypothetical protein
MLFGIFALLLQCNHVTMSSSFEWILYSHKMGNQCLLYDERLFCQDQDLLPGNLLSCMNGLRWNFLTLKENNSTTDDLISWQIPFEAVELYANYLDTSSTNSFICNCTHGRFGPACQYMLFSDQSTIAEILENQLSDPNQRESELLTCLVDSIECNAGLLCLEWRQVCDGIVHCDNEVDEAECYLLEFQNCAFDEFQCRNSMCIPLEFLFDGVIDCMDVSDEQEVMRKIQEILKTCPIKSTWECDERLCRKDEFSCGDGQCIHWSNLIHHQDRCENTRDLAYNCEIAAFGTMSSGVCRRKGNGE